jgi:tetratricopeptide (TPR) repeat protein/TolB-like protein
LTMPDRDRYQAALGSLADGAEVDWAELDSSAATSAERRRYRNLRLVARVAELHRTLTLDENGTFPLLDRERDAAAASPSTWGHLRIGERIASGAYGEIYLAHDPQLNRDVALKILRRGAAAGHSLDQLLVEARTLAKVRHPNVVTIHGAEVRDGRVGLWMELIHGQTLETWLRTHGTMGAGEAGALGIDVCRALAAVHAAGLVHGDIKAQNVMREDGGRLVLMDFGAGRVQGSGAANVAGTPMYLAPEVLAGGPPTPRSDIYSVGVLLFHLLTDAYPCTAADLDGLRAAHASGERVWLRDLRPDLPDSLVDAIERALDPDPARRFASAGEMERALAGGLPGRVTPHAGMMPARSRLLGFVAAAAVFVAIVAALVAWSRVIESRRGVVLTDVRTIGVLPMRDLTGSSLPPHFAEGLTDELIATLGQVERLTIKSGLSGVRGTDRSVKDVARALDVDALLETTLSSGTEEGAGKPARLKVRAKLIAAGTQGVVWTQEFERPRGDTLALPIAVAEGIARAVRTAVTEPSRLAAPPQTNPATEDAYLEGRTQLTQYGTGSFDKALKAFQRALLQDPGHAGAHAGAARAYLNLGLYGAMSHTRARSAAYDEVRRALDIQPDLAEAHATLAHIMFIYDWHWADAEREFLRSIQLNPNSPYARVFYADDLAAMRRFNESLEQGAIAKRLDPESGAAARRYALFLYYKHDFGAAARALDEAERIEPNNAGLPVLKSRIAEAEGRYEEALELANRALELSGDGGVPLRVHKVRLQFLAGHTDEATDGLRTLEAEAATGAIQLTSRDRAYVQLALGNKNRALQLFSRAVEERDASVVWLGVDPRLDGLQHDPQLRDLLRVIGIPLVP